MPGARFSTSTSWTSNAFTSSGSGSREGWVVAVGLGVVIPQALNASRTTRCNRMEIRRFIGNLPLWHLLRFLRCTDSHNYHSVYLAAVIPVESKLEIKCPHVKTVFSACK